MKLAAAHCSIDAAPSPGLGRLMLFLLSLSGLRGSRTVIFQLSGFYSKLKSYSTTIHEACPGVFVVIMGTCRP